MKSNRIQVKHITHSKDLFHNTATSHTFWTRWHCQETASFSSWDNLFVHCIQAVFVFIQMLISVLWYYDLYEASSISVFYKHSSPSPSDLLKANRGQERKGGASDRNRNFGKSWAAEIHQGTWKWEEQVRGLSEQKWITWQTWLE